LCSERDSHGTSEHLWMPRYEVDPGGLTACASGSADI